MIKISPEMLQQDPKFRGIVSSYKYQIANYSDLCANQAARIEELTEELAAAKEELARLTPPAAVAE